MGLFNLMVLLYTIVAASKNDDVQASGNGNLIEVLVALMEKQTEKIDEVMDALGDAKDDIEELKLKLTDSDKELERAMKDIKWLRNKLSSSDRETSKDISVLNEQQAQTTRALRTVGGKVNETSQDISVRGSQTLGGKVHETSQDKSFLNEQLAETTTALKIVGGEVNEVDEKYFKATQNLDRRIGSVEDTTGDGSVEDTTGDWPQGKYCILASGTCPKGFTKYTANHSAIRVMQNFPFLTTNYFGDSYIRAREGGDDYSELQISACCK